LVSQLPVLAANIAHSTPDPLTPVNEMAARIDNLETAIQDLMHDGTASPTTTPTKKK
jgi:hypothetical protein